MVSFQSDGILSIVMETVAPLRPWPPDTQPLIIPCTYCSPGIQLSHQALPALIAEALLSTQSDVRRIGAVAEVHASLFFVPSLSQPLYERNVGFYQKDREATQTEWGLKMM